MDPKPKSDYPSTKELNRMLANGEITAEEAEKALKARSREETGQEAVRNDLIVEEHAGKSADELRGSNREVWEYETDKSKPTGSLIRLTVAIVAAGLISMAIIFYKILQTVQ